MDKAQKVRRSIMFPLRRMMLFSVGSALILQEKTIEFVEHAVERGQAAQDEGKTIVQEMRSRRKTKEPKVKDAVDTRIKGALERLDVPSQKDIDELNQHISTLTQRIDELKSAG